MPLSKNDVSRLGLLRDALEEGIAEEILDDVLALSAEELQATMGSRRTGARTASARQAKLSKVAATKNREHAPTLGAATPESASDATVRSHWAVASRMATWLVGDMTPLPMTQGLVLGRTVSAAQDPALNALSFDLKQVFPPNEFQTSLPWAGWNLRLIRTQEHHGDDVASTFVVNIDAASDQMDSGRLILQLTDRDGHRMHAELSASSRSNVFVGGRLEGDWLSFTMTASLTGGD